MERTYGNEKTELELTEKAQAAYSDIDPLRIVERETIDGFVYDIIGAIECHNMTAKQVNDLLEQWLEN